MSSLEVFVGRELDGSPHIRYILVDNQGNQKDGVVTQLRYIESQRTYRNGSEVTKMTTTITTTGEKND